MSARVESLLLEIARCPVVVECMGGARHPCATIVASQGTDSLDQFQVPEPWSGDLERTPLLFVASNPSISDTEAYPRWAAGDTSLIDYFERRFGGGQQEWIRGGTRGLQADGTYGRAVAFWSAIRGRAAELLERAARPGLDYAITEAVRCKSRDEIGVADAADVCSDRYLRRTVEASGARVVVVLGSHARYAIGRVFGLPLGADIEGPVDLGGVPRYFAFLPHPNARMLRTFSSRFAPEQIEALRAALR